MTFLANSIQFNIRAEICQIFSLVKKNHSEITYLTFNLKQVLQKNYLPKDLCRAKPCLTMRSWHVWRSSNLEPRSLTMLISSILSISWPLSSSRSWLRPEPPKMPPEDSSSSDSILWMALALANSSAVTHLWRSTWNQCENSVIYVWFMSFGQSVEWQI